VDLLESIPVFLGPIDAEVPEARGGQVRLSQGPVLDESTVAGRGAVDLPVRIPPPARNTVNARGQ
jgi:hypothetical protein